MSDGNFVKMERKCCHICGDIHSFNAGILLDKHFKDIKEENTITGYSRCEPCDVKYKEEYLALVVITNDEEGELITNENANRAGALIHMRMHVAKDMFNFEITENMDMIFIDQNLESQLKELMKNVEK